MVSQIWVRRKTNLCELCERVMDVGEQYAARLEQLDVCWQCAERIGLKRS